MQKQSLHVNLFWDNQPLSKLEYLCLKSYIRYFDIVNVFTYNTQLFKEINYNKLNVYDANDILPQADKFYYGGNGDCPDKSVVGFSDLFRYMLLYKVGGWYADFDTVCLKPFVFDDDVVLRYHYKYNAIANICKFNKQDSVLHELYNVTKTKVRADNTNWCLPLEIFRDVISERGYGKYITKGVFNDDNIEENIMPFLTNSVRDVDTTDLYAIHWCRSAISSGAWSCSHYYDTNNPLPGTYLSMLYDQYDIR